MVLVWLKEVTSSGKRCIAVAREKDADPDSTKAVQLTSVTSYLEENKIIERADPWDKVVLAPLKGDPTKLCAVKGPGKEKVQSQQYWVSPKDLSDHVIRQKVL